MNVNESAYKDCVNAYKSKSTIKKLYVQNCTYIKKERILYGVTTTHCSTLSPYTKFPSFFVGLMFNCTC